jgi:predicted dehydrogenase
MKVGIIGLGYWGPNIVRVIQQSGNCNLAGVCDLDPAKVASVMRHNKGITGYTNAADLLASDISSVLIATSISTHYDLATQALLAGKHVFVEKPLCDSAAKAEKLVDLAEARGLILMAGHTFVYSPPVVKIKELIDSGVIGRVHYVSLSRVNLGLYQKDVDVMWDLAVHDISILLYWLNEAPIAAFSFGRSCVQQAKNDVAFLWFQFSSGTIASCEVSWLSPQKLRRICVVGSERMIAYDDTEPDEKVKVYNRGVNFKIPDSFGEFQLTYRMGDMSSPHLANVEPLTVEIDHFIDCCLTGKVPRTDGKFGLEVVRALELATMRIWNAEPIAHEFVAA